MKACFKIIIVIDQKAEHVAYAERPSSRASVYSPGEAENRPIITSHRPEK